MEFFVIKKEDKTDNPCPYWYGDSWGSKLLKAKQFDCPFEAEVKRKTLAGTNISIIARVTLREDEIDLSFMVKPTTRDASLIVDARLK